MEQINFVVAVKNKGRTFAHFTTNYLPVVGDIISLEDFDSVQERYTYQDFEVKQRWLQYEGDFDKTITYVELTVISVNA